MLTPEFVRMFHEREMETTEGKAQEFQRKIDGMLLSTYPPDSGITLDINGVPLDVLEEVTGLYREAGWDVEVHLRMMTIKPSA